MFRLPLLLSLALLAGLPALTRGADRPHIVLVMADDQGWGDMAYQGHERVVTPNFDEAAASGLRFDRFYAAAPVCSPTRASVLTGRTPNRLGVYKWGYPMRPQEVTLAEALKEAGYTTGHFGKWHLGSVRKDSPASPGACGFDHWVSAPNFYDNDAVMSEMGKAVPHQGESSFIAVDAALEWMREKVKEEAPLFAVIWFGSPHSPHIAVDQDRAHYADLDEKDQHFLSEVTGMDRAYGKLRDSLSELGIRDNTILWYCSDNGALPKVGSTGGFRGNKGKVYEGGLLVPSILEWPARVTQPRRTATRCVTSDIFPTVLDLAGVDLPAGPALDGVSLKGIVDGGDERGGSGLGFWDANKPGIRTPSEEWMGELLAAQQKGEDLPAHESSAAAAELPDPAETLETVGGHGAWIDGDWKLHRIVDKKGSVSWELYDLSTDPYEETDLASSEQARVKQMKRQLLEWMDSVVASLNGADY